MIWVLIIAVIFVLDRLSKLWVLGNLVDNPITVISNFFYLRHLENRGAAFSILHGKIPFLVITTSIVSIFLIYYLIKYNQKLLRVALSMILGGAFGNLYDRIFRGSVVDFLEFHFGSYVFPSFNVSDTFVVCGTILLAIYILFIHKDEKSIDLKRKEQAEETK